MKTLVALSQQSFTCFACFFTKHLQFITEKLLGQALSNMSGKKAHIKKTYSTCTAGFNIIPRKLICSPKEHLSFHGKELRFSYNDYVVPPRE